MFQQLQSRIGTLWCRLAHDSPVAGTRPVRMPPLWLAISGLRGRAACEPDEARRAQTGRAAHPRRRSHVLRPSGECRHRLATRRAPHNRHQPKPKHCEDALAHAQTLLQLIPDPSGCGGDSGCAIWERNSEKCGPPFRRMAARRNPGIVFGMIDRNSVWSLGVLRR